MSPSVPPVSRQPCLACESIPPEFKEFTPYFNRLHQAPAAEYHIIIAKLRARLEESIRRAIPASTQRN